MNAKVKPTEASETTEIALAIAVLNYVSCGKTTVARQLLSPRLGNAKIVPIESINKDAGQDDAVDASNFRSAMVTVDNLIANDKNVIVDIGASNVEICLSKMKQEKAFSDFDFFVLPATPDKRTIANTVSAIHDLVTKFGVDASKIRVVFNRVPMDSAIPIKDMFAPIYNICADKKIMLSDIAVIHDSEVFDMIGLGSLAEVAASNYDYRALQRQATTDAQRIAVSTKRVLFKMSGDTLFELDGVFDALFSGAVGK
jgi:hypothetical protein